MTIQSVTVFGQCGRYFLNSGPRSFHEHIGFLAKYMSTTIRLMFCLPLGQKSFLRIPRNQTARPRSRFLLSCIYERFLYSQDWSACLHCIWLQQNWQTDPGNICVNHECENWVTEHYNFFVVNLWAMQFHFWEYISLNQTFILDSHRTFICSDYQQCMHDFSCSCKVWAMFS